MVALASAALKWGLFDQLRAAREGAAVIDLAMYSLLAAPGFAVLGLLLVIFGNARFLPDASRTSRKIASPPECSGSSSEGWFSEAFFIFGSNRRSPGSDTKRCRSRIATAGRHALALPESLDAIMTHRGRSARVATLCPSSSSRAPETINPR